MEVGRNWYLPKHQWPGESPLPSFQLHSRLENARRQSVAGVGRVQQCCLNPWFHSVLLRLPALHSSCRLVIRHLKNSYTDHAMAVEGIW